MATQEATSTDYRFRPLAILLFPVSTLLLSLSTWLLLSVETRQALTLLHLLALTLLTKTFVGLESSPRCKLLKLLMRLASPRDTIVYLPQEAPGHEPVSAAPDDRGAVEAAEDAGELRVRLRA